jgi:hypothetical protein
LTAVDWLSTPLVECFERGDVPRDVRLVAAVGGLALQVPEQIAILMLLASDPDATIAARARRTIVRLPKGTLASFLGNPDVPERVRDFFAARAEDVADQTTDEEPVEDDDAKGEAETTAGTEAGSGEAPDGASDGALAQEIGEGSSAAADQSVAHAGALRRLSTMNVAERIKAAMQGTREERSILIRDPNRVVAAAVLSSPKLSESDVEAIARMTNVSDEVLRQIGTSRLWAKSYSVVASLARNAKTPVGVSLALLPRLAERDVRILAADRNVPEAVRLSARKLTQRNTSRRQ